MDQAKTGVQNSNSCFSPSLPKFLDFKGVFSFLVAHFLIQSHRSPHRPYEESDCPLSAHEVQREAAAFSKLLSDSEGLWSEGRGGREESAHCSPKLLLLVSHLSPSGRRVFLSSCQFAESKFVASGEAFEEVPVAFQGPLVCWERLTPPSA